MNPPSDPSPSCRSWPFAHPVRPRCTLATRTTPADCPSGQWERTVNPSAYAYPGSNPGSATKVRAISDPRRVALGIGVRDLCSPPQGRECVVPGTKCTVALGGCIPDDVVDLNTN